MKPKNKKAKPSLLARLFGGKGKAEPEAKKTPARKRPAPKSPPPSRLDRSISEIKTMVRIGESNPARLATILTSIIKAEQAKKAKADEEYRKLIQDILDRQQQKEQEQEPLP